MTNEEIISNIKKSYTLGIEKATLRRESSFAILKDNILFGVSACPLNNIESTEDYFYNTVEKAHFFRIESFLQMSALFIEMNAFKHKTEKDLYSILSSGGVDHLKPFYLKIYLFEGVRL